MRKYIFNFQVRNRVIALRKVPGEGVVELFGGGWNPYFLTLFVSILSVHGPMWTSKKEAQEGHKSILGLFFVFGSGGGIRTRDLRVMSPTSYQAAPPRIS